MDKRRELKMMQLIHTWTPKAALLAQGWKVSVELGRVANIMWDASVSYNDGERTAIIILDQDRIEPDDLPEILIHEFAHLALRDYDRITEVVIEQNVAPNSQKMVEKLLLDELERSCDVIAAAVLQLGAAQQRKQKQGH